MVISLDLQQNGEEFCIWVCFTFFFFFLIFVFMQNAVSRIVIGIGRVMYYIKAIKVVIRATFKNFQKIVPVSRKLV